MTWDIIRTVAAIALIAFTGWFLVRLLKDRQASDRGYGGENDTPDVGGGRS